MLKNIVEAVITKFIVFIKNNYLLWIPLQNSIIERQPDFY